jgi:hypothetical protein
MVPPIFGRVLLPLAVVPKLLLYDTSITENVAAPAFIDDNDDEVDGKLAIRMRKALCYRFSRLRRGESNSLL